jgi:hypothetical protein
MVLFALFGAALTAYLWSSACTAKPLDTFLVDQAWAIGLILFGFALPGALARRNLFPELRNFALPWAPFYLVGLVRPIASMTVAWEGGWSLGIAGAAAGAAAGAVVGWLFTRWTLPDIENRRPERARPSQLPIAFAVLFALLGAYNWAVEWVTLDQAWAIGVAWMFLALPGALVGRPFLGLLVMSPFVLVTLVPLVASMTVGWEGGWVLGIAGAAAGAVAGAATGWLFTRLILPDTEIPRVRGRAVRMTVAFAVLFALFGAYSWATAWPTPDQAWGIGILLIGSALPGALVGRPFLGLLVALPLVLVLLVPVVASMTVEWEGGWILGIAGAPAGAAAGAAFGWLFNRWIMPEYDKRREGGSAVRPPGSSDGPGLNRS